MTSVQQEPVQAQLPVDLFSSSRSPDMPQSVIMDIKQEGGQVKKEEFIFGPLLGKVRSPQQPHLCHQNGRSERLDFSPLVCACTDLSISLGRIFYLPRS